jgi:hypothetical protein
LLFKDCDPASPGYKKERRVYRNTGKGGTTFKVSIINAGDHPDLQYPVNSCTAQHLVLIQGRGMSPLSLVWCAMPRDEHRKSVAA